MNNMTRAAVGNLTLCPPRQEPNRCERQYNQSQGLTQQNYNGVKRMEPMNAVQVQQSQALIATREQEFAIIEQVVMQGDLSKLNPEQRVLYYRKVCESVGLNPFTRPFDYIFLNGKLTLYAKKDATEQLRKINGISIDKIEGKLIDDLYIVTARARTRDGRIDESTGVVTIGNLKGDQKANAIMKAETKAKRRVTLSISGMGFIDETELESIPTAKRAEINLSTGEINGETRKIESDPKLSLEQAEEIEVILENCDEKYRNWVYEYVKKQYGSEGSSSHENFKNLLTTAVPSDMYERIRNSSIKNAQETRRSKNSQETVMEAV